MKGEDIKKIRNLAKLDQKNFGKLIGYSKRTIIIWEHLEEISENIAQIVKLNFPKEYALIIDITSEIELLKTLIECQKSEISALKKNIILQEEIICNLKKANEQLKKQDAPPVLDAAAESRQPYQPKTKS